MTDTPELRRQTRDALTVLVYSVTVFLGSVLFVPDPTSLLVFLPVIVGSALLVHALRTANLDELGYAIIGLWLAILLLSGGTGVVDTFVVGGQLAPLTAIPATRVLGTVGLLTVLVGTYRFFVGREQSGPESG